MQNRFNIYSRNTKAGSMSTNITKVTCHLFLNVANLPMTVLSLNFPKRVFFNQHYCKTGKTFSEPSFDVAMCAPGAVH